MAIEFSSFPNGFNAVVIGASGGIGQAFVRGLSEVPNVGNIFAVSRHSVDLPNVRYICGDITDESSIAKAASEVHEHCKAVNLVIVATGILHDDQGVEPEKSLANIKPENFERIFALNTTGPAIAMKHFLPLLPRDENGIFAALSARVGSIEDNHLGGWYGYRASKAALNMLIKSASIEVARRYKRAAVIGLHPGTVKTSLSEPFSRNVPEGKLFTPEYAASCLLNVMSGLDETHTGKIFDYAGQQIPY